jgi:hypothetical protein
MEYTISADHEARCIMVVAKGPATLPGIRSYVEELTSAPFAALSYGVLTDLSTVDARSLTAADIKQISALSFGYARMFQLLAEDKVPLNTRVFHDRQKAMEWLKSAG